MKKPLLRDDAFLEDVARSRGSERAFRLWWLGQSGFLLQWRGRHLLFDPYLSDSLTAKYAGTDKPHVRITERVVDPARLGFVDAVTSSHNHTDHLDRETLGPILAANPRVEVVVAAANRDFAAARLGVPPSRLAAATVGSPVHAGGFELHAVPAAHEDVALDEHGRHLYVGFVAELGPHRIYHSGDTVLHDGLAPALRRWRIDAALLPINGRSPERRVAGNLDGREAAALARSIGAAIAIPCHFDLFEFNTASPAEFVAECERIGQPCRVLENGEGWSPE